MKNVVIILVIVCCFIPVSRLFSQPMTTLWTVPSFVQPCSDTLKYRYVYAGPISFDSSGTLVWFFRNRSTCITEQNNFAVLNVKPSGTPLLATLGQFETPAYSYYETIASHKNRVYWAGSSYALDSNHSLILIAYDGTIHNQLWMGINKLNTSISNIQSSIAATDDAIYTAINYSLYAPDSNGYSSKYYMLLTKWDTAGHIIWNNNYAQEFSQGFRGNLIITDSIIYACGIRYSESVPYEFGMGFIGAYRVSDGVFVDSFYFSRKRQESEFIPTTLLKRDSLIVVCGVNSSTADAAVFISGFTLDLDLLSFEETPSASAYFTTIPATLDENKFLYYLRSDYNGTSYRTVIDIANCNDGKCHTIRRNVLLDPYLSILGDIQATKGALYLSMMISSRDSSRSYYPIYDYDAVLTKYDVALLGVGISSDRSSSFPVSVYPNPIATIAKFTMYQVLYNGELVIVDGLGRTVRSYKSLQGSEFILDKQELSSGVYFYFVRENGLQVGSGKIVIE